MFYHHNLGLSNPLSEGSYTMSYTCIRQCFSTSDRLTVMHEVKFLNEISAEAREWGVMLRLFSVFEDTLSLYILHTCCNISTLFAML